MLLSKEHPDLKTSESLSAGMRSELRKRLDDYGIKMVNYYAPIDSKTEAFRSIFDFAKEMGVKTLVAEPPAVKFAWLYQEWDALTASAVLM